MAHPPARTIDRARALGLAACLASGCVSPASAPTGAEHGDDAAPASSAANEESSRASGVHGSSSTRVVSRQGGDGEDVDLRESLVLDVGDARTERVTAHVFGLVTADLDGAGDSASAAAFPSLADTFRGAVDAWLYQAYVDVTGGGPLERVRVGRQIDYETPEFAFFDGIALTSAECGAQSARFGLYGGVSAHLYEASHSGDFLGGASGECRPWSSGRVRLDWMHVEDEARYAAHEDDLLSASAWQRAGDALRFDTRFTTLEGDARDLKLGGEWNDAQHDFVARATWRRLFSTQKDLAVELDPFYGSLASLYPYDQLGVSLEKGFGERVVLGAGFDVRRVADEGDIGEQNRDYDRVFASSTVSDFLGAGLELDVDADFWDAEGRVVSGLGVAVSREFASGFAASLGTYYSLYKFDFASSTERDHVRTWFVELERAWSKTFSGELAYELEDADDDTFHTLRVGVTWRF